MPLAHRGSTQFHVGVYTVAGLPTTTTLPTLAAGDIAFASNGRKGAEGAAAGTGVLVYWDGTAWRRVDDGATVLA